MAGATIVLDEVTPLLARVKSAAQARGLALVGAREVASRVKQHLLYLNDTRHRAGGSNFYAKAARSVSSAVVPQGAAVTISQTGFRQRLFGGRIVAGQNGSGRRFLTIPDPDAPEAFTTRAPEMNDLHVQKRVNPRTQHLQFCLVRNLSTPVSFKRRKDKNGVTSTKIVAGSQQGGQVIFWLVRSVTQQADPSVLPPNDSMIANAKTAIVTELQRLAWKQTGKELGDL